jgi:hypothetical protein
MAGHWQDICPLVLGADPHLLQVVFPAQAKATLVEPTIVYENTPTSLQQGNKVKIQKYRPLSDVIKDEHGDDEVEFYGLALQSCYYFLC